MTITQAFVAYMESLALGTLGETIFIGAAPLDAPDAIFWIINSGGAPLGTNQTGEKRKQYILSVYYRSRSAEGVDEILQSLEETINIGQCTQLQDFDTIDIEASSFASDQDLDNEDRTVGLLQITITTYK
jgi:hypothetical protein